jgi:cell division protease FtsH
MAEALMEYETLSSGQIDDIMEGRPVRPPQEDVEDSPPPSAGSAQPRPSDDDGGGTITPTPRPGGA